MGKICDRRGRTIARVESLGAENLEAQEHYSRYNNSNFFVYYYGPVSLQILVIWNTKPRAYRNPNVGILSGWVSKNKHNYRLPRFCVFLYQV